MPGVGGSPDGITFVQADAGSGDAARLLAEYGREIAEMYDGLDVDDPSMPKAGPGELGPPDGAFLVGYRGSVPVCCGGMKRLPDGACEFKRMYVVPQARRQGLARALLDALEELAAGRGYTVARMDTGPRHQHAVALYEAAGYRPVENFNGNPVATWFGEKSLG